MTSYSDLRSAAADRHRKRLFGDASLDVYDKSPSGETLIAAFTDGWFAHRLIGLSDKDSRAADAGAWQFQVPAAANWESSETAMLKAASLRVGTRRWKVNQVEKPIGISLIWKIKAEIQ